MFELTTRQFHGQARYIQQNWKSDTRRRLNDVKKSADLAVSVSI